MCEWCTVRTEPYRIVAFSSKALLDPSVQTNYITTNEPNLCVAFYWYPPTNTI